MRLHTCGILIGIYEERIPHIFITPSPARVIGIGLIDSKARNSIKGQNLIARENTYIWWAYWTRTSGTITHGELLTPHVSFMSTSLPSEGVDRRSELLHRYKTKWTKVTAIGSSKNHVFNGPWRPKQGRSSLANATFQLHPNTGKSGKKRFGLKEQQKMNREAFFGLKMLVTALLRNFAIYSEFCSFNRVKCVAEMTMTMKRWALAFLVVDDLVPKHECAMRCYDV